MVHLEFSLSLEQVDKTQSYYLEIKAPQIVIIQLLGMEVKMWII